MSVLFFILGIIGGAGIAFLLNKLLSGKIENKGHRIGLQVTSYIVCIILGIFFTFIGSLRIILNNFIENRIEFVEFKLNEAFPGEDLLNEAIDTNELVSAIEDIQETMDDINTINDGFFESMIFDAFMNELAGYVDKIESGVNTARRLSDENGMLTIKSILRHLKDMALDTVSPYFIIGQVVIVILLLIFFGIYAGIVLFLKKGGATYNKSIVFGEVNYDDNNENKENIKKE